MFEICNDKTYFLAETTAKNKTIEITLVKDSHGNLLNEHEIKLDLCRAVLELQRGGYIVTKVRALDYDIENVVDVFHLPEFEEACENPMPDIVSVVISSNFDSGASFHLPCKVNKKTREVFAVEVPAQPCDDDSFRNATVNVDGVDRSLLNLTDIVSEYDSDDYDGVLDALYHVQAKNDYWENDGESLTDLIHKYRWYILKDALMQRGRDAVTDFIGTDISSSEFSRVLDETEMVMPDETFEKFWEKYILAKVRKQKQPSKSYLKENHMSISPKNEASHNNTAKRRDYISWDEYFMGIAMLSAMRSKDPNSQVGACIVRDNKILSLGYNGMPIGCDDDIMPWGREGNELETKYMYVCHSELNAILNAGKDLHGSTMYVTLFPCNECAKAIIQSGIKRIVYLDDKYRNANNNVAARHMFRISGVETEKYKPTARNISLNL